MKHANKQVWSVNRKKKELIATVPEKAQKLHLLDKDFYNMFKELRETKSK